MTTRKINVPGLFFVFTVAFCSLTEIVLLEVKYQLFSGGFLQSHQLDTGYLQLAFSLLAVLFNALFYGLIYLLLKTIAGRLNVKSSVIAFHFMMFCAIVSSVVLTLQFQLHKYFSDAMDAMLIKNIAGGDLKTAILYVLDETILFILGIGLILCFYYLSYRIVRKNVFDKRQEMPRLHNRTPALRALGYSMAAFITIALLVLSINTHEDLRFNLARVNAYRVLVNGYDELSDFDRDGYGSFSFPRDTSVFDANIYPGALDIPNNGIDEDGFFGDFVVTPHLEESPLPLSRPSTPLNVVIVILESARADLYGKKINNQLVAPNVHELAKEGRVIKEAYSHTGYTGSSLASFFSGKITSFDLEESLFYIFKNAGYEIAVFSGQDESWSGLDTKLGTRELADHFFDAQTGIEERVFSSKLPSSIKLSEQTLWERFQDFSQKTDWEAPKLVYFNMQAAHFPYYHEQMTKTFVDTGIPRSKIDSTNKDWLENTYWNALNYADHYIGKIIQQLKYKNVWENTLFIVAGDHGEELFDSNHLGHGFSTSQVQTNVPLIVNKSDFIIQEPVGHIDIKDSILSYIFNSGATHSEQSSNEKFVFQLVGSLHNPGRIALRYKDNRNITFDLKNRLVQPIDDTQWLTYEVALLNEEIHAQLNKLIAEWANLRWLDRL